MTHVGWCLTDFSFECASTHLALPSLRYAVWQLERCPESGRLHIQGYIECPRQQRLSWCKKNVSGTAHFDPRFGTQSEAIAYCTKEETRVEGPWYYGTKGKQGKRNDLVAVTAMIQEGKSIFDVASEHPSQYIRYHKGIERLTSLLRPPCRRNFIGTHYIWGPPQVGKSTWVLDKYPDAYYAQDTKEGWFDGYTGQSVVVFDEFDGLFPRSNMLKLCSFMPLQLPTKGGFVAIAAVAILFTSNRCPTTLYGSDPAWLARLSHVDYFGDREVGGSITPHFHTPHTS